MCLPKSPFLLPAALQLEMLALRNQLHVVERSRRRRWRLSRADRCLWVWLSRVWTEWRAALVIVKPETVIAWHRHHEWRTHLSLGKDAPVPRTAQPPNCGTIVQVPHVGGLHHHYEHRAA